MKRYRHRVALTQRELAQRVGVTYATIARIETGKQEARPTTLRKIAAALGVQPAELIDESAA